MLRRVLVLALTTALVLVAISASVSQTVSAQDDNVVIEVWSHFANEPTTRLIIESVFTDYEAEHPNVDIQVTWYDKEPLRNTIRTTMLAGGSEAPDITTFDTADIDWVEAGWLLNLDDVLPWENFVAGAREAEMYAGIDGVFKFNFAFTVDYILYNKEIFAELGIEVPDDFQFTQAEFVDVVKTCNEAGYAGLADAIGNRPYPGTYPTLTALVNLVGSEEFGKYYRGEQSWDTPEVRQALEWVAEMSDNGLWPESFASMTIDEYHIYFHTQRKACMLYNGTWYTARAFKPEEEGGQSPDFHFGMLRYPEMDGAQFNDTLRGSFPTGYAVLSSTEHPDIAKDILVFWASNPKYGAMQQLMNNAPSAIKYTAEDIPEDLQDNPWQWYWDEYEMVYGDLKVGVTAETPCGDFADAIVTTLNEGLPLGLISVDEAIEILDSSLCVD
jgi:ABC-type glycerol-3-phosphate transport system substrate-binding protein